MNRRHGRGKRRRRFQNLLAGEDEDPLAGMANLFDAGMVFAVALLLALVSYYKLPKLMNENKVTTVVKNPGKPNMQMIRKDGVKIEKYRMTKQRAGGEGEKLGVCYRLSTGEVVYIPAASENSENEEK